jgi:hypothetical protein
MWRGEMGFDEGNQIYKLVCTNQIWSIGVSISDIIYTQSANSTGRLKCHCSEEMYI